MGGVLVALPDERDNEEVATAQQTPVTCQERSSQVAQERQMIQVEPGCDSEMSEDPCFREDRA